MKSSYQSMNIHELYPCWLVARENHRACHLIDVRSMEEFSSGHVPGAELLPSSVLMERGSSIPKGEDVYLICRSGMRSAQAASFLADRFGYENLINIEGGTMAWVKAGYPIEKGEKNEQ
ncbi:MAG: rhodanese-like domain-containing protein [Mariprofundaceae bacterium]|nr:rhodanese-like domain-containing protein [Mariprofundaceae bacterium]